MIGIRTEKTRARFSRRALLKALGASAAFLPLLQAERALGAGEVPKRVITIAWTNGVPSSAFWPRDGSPVSSTVLKPLAPVGSKVLGPLGIDLKVMLDNGRKYDGHSAYPALFTATSARLNDRNVATGPSIDQVIADANAKLVSLPIPLLNVTPVTNVGRTIATTSYNKNGAVNTPESDPVRLFDTMFASRNQSAGAIKALKARRQSVLDLVGKDLQTFSDRLGTEDRAKIEEHLESIGQLQRQLASASDDTCEVPATGPTASGNFDGRLKAFLDLVALAIRCDLTRAVSMAWAGDYGGPPGTFPYLDINEDYHAIAHEGTAGYANKIKIDTWFYSQVAYLAKLLDDTEEVGGSALDHSVMIVANGMNEGSQHYNGRLPFVLIGGGDYFKTGRSLKLGAWAGKTGEYWTSDSGVPNNKLLASVCNALDVPTDQFGANYAGALPELRG